MCEIRHKWEEEIMTESEQLIAKFVRTAAADLASHHAAIQRVQENQQAEHKKLQELAGVLVDVQKTWMANFEALGELVNQQTRMLEAMRSIVLKHEPVN
jgi:hypothetical protein